MSSTPELTIFYDGACPLCSSEMQHLKRLDHQNRLDLFDLAADNANESLARQHPDINAAEADRILHAKTADGRLLLGLDVTHAAWSLVGRGFLTAPLRWRLIAPVADFCYLRFANHRHRISALLTGRWRTAVRGCNDGCRLN